MKYTLIIILCFIILVSPYDLGDLNGPDLFKNEICSYNGQPEIIDGGNNIKCYCNEDFATVKEDYNQINGINIQCNYEKKRRFICLFLSVFLPFGADYLYLGRTALGILFLLLCIIICFGNCYILIKIEKEKVKANDSSDNTNLERIKLMQLIFGICLIIYGLFYILNCFLMGFGVITDSHGLETVNDLKNLFSLYN